ncbi:hypothetical protein U1Q18_044730 [Sarracenia purpurea var. burkii]
MQSIRPVDRDVQLTAVQRLSGGDRSTCADAAELVQPSIPGQYSQIRSLPLRAVSSQAYDSTSQERSTPQGGKRAFIHRVIGSVGLTGRPRAMRQIDLQAISQVDGRRAVVNEMGSFPQSEELDDLVARAAVLFAVNLSALQQVSLQKTAQIFDTSPVQSLRCLPRHSTAKSRPPLACSHAVARLASPVPLKVALQTLRLPTRGRPGLSRRSCCSSPSPCSASYLHRLLRNATSSAAVSISSHRLTRALQIGESQTLMTAQVAAVLASLRRVCNKISRSPRAMKHQMANSLRIRAETFGTNSTDSVASNPQEDYSVIVDQKGYLSAFAQAVLFKGNFTGCDGDDKAGQALVLKKGGVQYHVVLTG